MKQTTVESSNIKRVGWKAQTLYVQFVRNNAIYTYAKVTSLIYDEMIAAESVGKYFIAQVKPAYVATLIEKKEAQDAGFKVD